MKKKVDPRVVAVMGVVGAAVTALAKYLEGHPVASLEDALRALLPTLATMALALFSNPYKRK